MNCVVVLSWLYNTRVIGNRPLKVVPLLLSQYTGDYTVGGISLKACRQLWVEVLDKRGTRELLLDVLKGSLTLLILDE